MYSINKRSTKKRHIKKGNKTKRTVGKNSKKRTSKKNKQKKNRKTKKGGSSQTYYWSPMRKLQFNPNLDNSLSEYDTPRQEVTDPAYNCRNPVTAVQSGGEIIVGNNEQTVGDYTVSTECPYEAQGSSSYAYNYPPGLSNGLIIDNNSTQSGGGDDEKNMHLPKVSNNKREKYKPKPKPATPQQIEKIQAEIKNSEDKIKKYNDLKKEQIPTKDGKKVNKNEIVKYFNDIKDLYEKTLKKSPLTDVDINKMINDKDSLQKEFLEISVRD